MTRFQRALLRLARPGRPDLFDSRTADPHWGYGPPSFPGVVGSAGEHALHPEERRWLAGGKVPGRRTRKYVPALAAALGNEPGPLPTHDELLALMHAGRSVRGEYAGSANRLAEMIGPENAALWGLASGIASARTRWESHTGGGLAALGEFLKAKSPRSRAGILAAVERASQQRFPGRPGSEETRPWGFALAGKQKRSKLVELLANRRRHLAALAALSSQDPRERAKAHRQMIANVTGGRPSWKTPNFATASLPPPYGDPHGGPIDYVFGTLMTPTVAQLKRGYLDLVRKGETETAKKGGDRRFDPTGEVGEWLRAAVKRHGLSDEDLAHPVAREIGAMRTRRGGAFEGRWGSDPANKLVNLLKAGQLKQWTDPQLALAAKALVGHAAYHHGYPELREAQEAPWAAALGVMGAKDADPTGRASPRDLMTEEQVRANWDLLGTLAQERSRPAFRAAGASGREFDDLVRQVQRRAPAGATPLMVPPHLQRPFDQVAARIPSGQMIGGEAGRKVLEQHPRRKPAAFARPRPGVPGGYQTALAVARSRAAMAVSHAISKTLAGLGVHPHRVSRAVLASGGRFLPAAVASVYRDVPDHKMLAAAGWQGMMGQVPGVVAFKAGPGPDQLHRVEHLGPVGELVKKLHAAGAYTSALIPTRHGTTALVYDKGGRKAPYLAAAGLNFASAGGQGQAVGKDDLRDAARIADMPGGQ